MPAHDESSRLFAAQVLLQKLQALRQEIDGVRAGKDIEFVHRMRVASRRMRAALAVFTPCLGARQTRKWTKGIRRITRALGEARDADVQLEFLRDFLSTLADRAARTGINRLILRLKQGRSRCQADVCKAMDRLAEAGLLEEMTAQLEQLRDRDMQHRVPATSPALYNLAGAAIAAHLVDLLSHEPSLADPLQIAQHHAMRIAAKHLRYTMEIFEPLYDNALECPLSAAKKCQSALGDIHDCDVWIDRLPQFMEEERQRISEYLGRSGPIKRIAIGIELLRQDRASQRADRFFGFAEYWRQQQSEGLWARLRETVAARMTVAATPNPDKPASS